MRVLLVSEGAHELSGALRSLVIRLGLQDCTIDCSNVRGDIHVHHGKGQGYFKRAVRWMLEAQKQGYDALVLVIDHDNFEERTRELTQAQEHSATFIPRALGVAIKSFDAWMLADEQALSAVLGFSVPRQPDPETNPRPKDDCSNLRMESKQMISQSEMYAQIGELIDIDALIARCPKGFAPFAMRVRAITSA